MSITIKAWIVALLFSYLFISIGVLFFRQAHQKHELIQTRIKQLRLHEYIIDLEKSNRNLDYNLTGLIKSHNDMQKQILKIKDK